MTPQAALSLARRIAQERRASGGRHAYQTDGTVTADVVDQDNQPAADTSAAPQDAGGPVVYGTAPDQVAQQQQPASAPAAQTPDRSRQDIMNDPYQDRPGIGRTLERMGFWLLEKPEAIPGYESGMMDNASRRAAIYNSGDPVLAGETLHKEALDIQKRQAAAVPEHDGSYTQVPGAGSGALGVGPGGGGGGLGAGAARPDLVSAAARGQPSGYAAPANTAQAMNQMDAMILRSARAAMATGDPKLTQSTAQIMNAYQSGMMTRQQAQLQIDMMRYGMQGLQEWDQAGRAVRPPQGQQPQAPVAGAQPQSGVGSQGMPSAPRGAGPIAAGPSPQQGVVSPNGAQPSAIAMPSIGGVPPPQQRSAAELAQEAHELAGQPQLGPRAQGQAQPPSPQPAPLPSRGGLHASPQVESWMDRRYPGQYPNGITLDDIPSWQHAISSLRGQAVKMGVFGAPLKEEADSMQNMLNDRLKQSTISGTGRGVRPGYGDVPGGVGGQGRAGVGAETGGQGGAQYFDQSDLYRPEPGVTEDPQGRAGIAKVQTDVDAAGGRLRQREQKMNDVQSVLDIMKEYETGAGVEFRAGLLHRLEALGISVPDKAWGPSWSSKDYEKFSATVLKDTLGEIKEIGGVRGNAGIRALERTAANPDLKPEANKFLLSKALGYMQYDQKYDTDLIGLNKQVSASGQALQSHAGFDANWDKQNPVRAFVKNVEQANPVAGAEEDRGPRPPGAPFEWGELNPFNRELAHKNVDARLAQRRWDVAAEEPMVKAMTYVGVPLVAGAALWAAFPQAMPAAWAAFKASGLAGKVVGAGAIYEIVKNLPEGTRDAAAEIVQSALGAGGHEHAKGGRARYASGGRIAKTEEQLRAERSALRYAFAATRRS